MWDCLAVVGALTPALTYLLSWSLRRNTDPYRRDLCREGTENTAGCF